MVERVTIRPHTRLEEEEREIFRAVRTINSVILGIILGLVIGAILFTATIWLVLKGGDPVGPHLGLLGQFFPGYTVTYPGSVIGFGYGALLGFAVGWFIGWIYNTVLFRLQKT